MLRRNQKKEDFKASWLHKRWAKKKNTGKAMWKADRDMPPGATHMAQSAAGRVTHRQAVPSVLLQTVWSPTGGKREKGSRTAEVKLGSNGMQNHM